MPRHARNNTNASSFTYAERQMLKDGTKRERLGRDSMKNFNACTLCLEVARDPRACDAGHLYCTECILSSLVAQKKDIKRQQVVLERMRVEAEEEMRLAREAARKRVLDEFDRAQSGLASGRTEGKAVMESKGVMTGEKRKAAFELDEKEVERLAEEATLEALNRTAGELAEQRKAKLPNFWLPSLTPSATPDSVLEVKLQTLCHASKPPHPVSLKTLTTVKFELDGAASGRDVTCICPVCRKSLTNNVKAYVVRPCGHVVCGMCADSLCRPDKQCAHCGTRTEKRNAFVELKREGTGFAAGGLAEAKKYDLPFQG